MPKQHSKNVIGILSVFYILGWSLAKWDFPKGELLALPENYHQRCVSGFKLMCWIHQILS